MSAILQILVTPLLKSECYTPCHFNLFHRKILIISKKILDTSCAIACKCVQKRVNDVSNFFIIKFRQEDLTYSLPVIYPLPIFGNIYFVTLVFITHICHTRYFAKQRAVVSVIVDISLFIQRYNTV